METVKKYNYELKVYNENNELVLVRLFYTISGVETALNRLPDNYSGIIVKLEGKKNGSK